MSMPMSRTRTNPRSESRQNLADAVPALADCPPLGGFSETIMPNCAVSIWECHENNALLR